MGCDREMEIWGARGRKERKMERIEVEVRGDCYVR